MGNAASRREDEIVALIDLKALYLARFEHRYDITVNELIPLHGIEYTCRGHNDNADEHDIENY